MRIMIDGGGSVARGLQAAAPDASVCAKPARARNQWLIVAVGILGVVIAFWCYLRLARTRAVDSDGASQALQAWDMLHGNVLLHGWWLSDVSFYTTELPQYMLVELVHGLNLDVVHVAAAMTYTLVLLFTVLLAKGSATGRAAVVRVLIAAGLTVAPQLAGVSTLIASPDHVGTAVPVLVVFLILDRAPQRPWVPVVVTALLFWAALADTLVLLIAVLPVALVFLLQPGSNGSAARRLRPTWYFRTIGIGSLAAGLAAELALPRMSAIGGFVVWPPHFEPVYRVDQLAHTFGVTGQGLLLLAGADFLGLRPGVSTAVVFLHSAGIILLTLGVLLAARRFGRDLGFIEQILLTAVVLNLGLYAFTSAAFSIQTTHEIVAVLPFSAVLAARMLADRVLAVRLVPAALLLVLAGYLAGFGYELAQPAAPVQNYQLTSWLAAHHLDSGLSGFWESNVVTLSSDDRVRIRQLTVARGRVIRYEWESAAAWYDPRQASANFVVLYPATGAYPGFTDRSAVVATFGPPAHTYRIGAYQVLVWRKNLLRKLPRAGAAIPTVLAGSRLRAGG
jgi:hypothetical protein